MDYNFFLTVVRGMKAFGLVFLEKITYFIYMWKFLRHFLFPFFTWLHTFNYYSFLSGEFSPTLCQRHFYIGQTVDSSKFKEIRRLDYFDWHANFICLQNYTKILSRMRLFFLSSTIWSQVGFHETSNFSWVKPHNVFVQPSTNWCFVPFLNISWLKTASPFCSLRWRDTWSL